MDGARIYNASIASGVPVLDYARHADSVMFCLSKGLSAPIGSMLVGPRDFIDYGRRLRKVLGGGMRQVGVLAAAGLLALTEMTGRLAEDHARARRLAEAMAGLPGLVLDPWRCRPTSSSSGSSTRALRRPPWWRRWRAAACGLWRRRAATASAWSPTRTSVTRTSTGPLPPSANPVCLTPDR